MHYISTYINNNIKKLQYLAHMLMLGKQMTKTLNPIEIFKQLPEVINF